MALEKIDIETLDPKRTIVVATGNAHKLTEIEAILSQVLPDVRFVALGQLGDFEDPEENGTTFVENAIIKAEAAVAATGLAAIADDSGLVVDALNGEPGVYSARYAGTHGDDEANNAKLLDKMQGVADADRTARFMSVVALIDAAGCVLTGTGACEGMIAREGRGSFGFGYDPLFLPTDTPEGFSRTLDKCLALAPDNLTVHTLALKKGSRILLDGLPVPGAAEVGQMLNYSAAHLSQAGYTPYYLYRQKYMSGNFENVGWSKPGAEGLYNIYIMEELHSILSVGAGGSTKLVDPRTGHIVRHFNCKYAKEYLEKPEKWTQNRAQFFAFERALLRDYGLLPEENTEGSDS